MSRFEVRRDGFEETRIAELPRRELDGGEVRLAIDCFAFTANNMTYAVAGDFLNYWRFFPVEDDSGFGVIPVWGFADVVESRSHDLPVGERLYGYFPPADELVIQPVKVSAGQLFDGSAHRRSLSPLYNRYQRVPAGGDRGLEYLQALLAPLYMTGYCIWDQLVQNAWYGAEELLILSASSKTSLGLAQAIADGGESPRVIGVTSPANAAFVRRTGLYDQVRSYDQLRSDDKLRSDDQLRSDDGAGRPAPVATVVVDMAGNQSVADALRDALGEQLRYFIAVGLTHWDQGGDGRGRPLPRHEMFFAPTYMLNRGEAMEPGEFARLAQSFVQRGAAKSAAWLRVTELRSVEGLAERYPAIMAGRMDPAEGLIVAL